MEPRWRFTIALAVVATGSAVAFRVPVLWVPDQEFRVLAALSHPAVWLGAVLTAGWVGWYYGTDLQPHIGGWFGASLLGTFGGWMVGYVGTELTLLAPVLYPRASIFVIIDIALQNYVFTGVVLGFAAIAGIGIDRLAHRPAGGANKQSLGVMSTLGLSLVSGASVGAVGLVSPQIPWDPDVFGVVQTVMTITIPLLVYGLMFAVAFQLHHAADRRVRLGQWLGVVVLGCVVGGMVLTIGWTLAVSSFVWASGGMLFALFVGLPAAVPLIAGIVCGQHGPSKKELTTVRQLLDDVTAEATE